MPMNKFSRRRFMAAAAIAGGPLLLGSRSARAAASPINATLTVEPEGIHALPQTQYGHFIEHLGRCIKGGLWAEREQSDMFEGGVRRELVSAIRAMNPALIRYPGGCFADGYHWQDGIGPREKRPPRDNRAWGKKGPEVGPQDDNHFGTDEFLRLCRFVGAEPMITVNVGSGTPEEAAAWVEYCNGSQNSPYGSQRVKNGHPDSYDVKYFFVGNEIFGTGEIGHLTPDEYVSTFRSFAQAMRRVDSKIKLIAVGSHFREGERSEINRIVIPGLRGVMDYLSIHQYAPRGSLTNTIRFKILNAKGSPDPWLYYDVLGSIATMEAKIMETVRDVDACCPSGKKVPIALDEWNLWFNSAADLVQDNFCLRDGLWCATMLNLLHRHAAEVPIANLAQMVNCLGIIVSDKRGTFLTPSGLVFQLYTENAGDMFLPSAVDCPEMPHVAGIPVVDVSATRGRDEVALFMVNRHYDAEVALGCKLNGLPVEPWGKSLEMYHRNPVQYNTFNKPKAVSINEKKIDLQVSGDRGGSSFTVKLKPHSLLCLKLGLKK